MFLDKKGETLYVTGDDFDEQVIHSFQVNWDKGTLTNLEVRPSRRTGNDGLLLLSAKVHRE